jgi:RHS repeat-associated protein
VGNLTRETDGRGIRTDYAVNQLNQVVQITRAADVAAAAGADPSDPLFNHSDVNQRLTAFAYLERIFYDFNNNVVLRQVEDRGNTSSVDGNPPATDLPSYITNPDALGGTAYVDTVYRYDLLDQQVELVQEVQNGPTPADQLFLRTRTRYDRNGNGVFTIHPAGNASASVYDERDLLLQSTRGANTLSPDGLYAGTEPMMFNRPGGLGTAPSTLAYNYDKNRNLIETVDAQDNQGAKSLIFPLGPGAGDVTRTTYDGFDRRRTVTDALDNRSTSFYDPASNVVRGVQDGAPRNDIPGSAGNVPLAASETIYDELSRAIVSHRVLFQTPGATPQRMPTLSDTVAMDGLAAYLSAGLDTPGTDTDAAPGALGMVVVIGRVSALTEYDRVSRVTFTVQDDLDVRRTFYDGAGRVIESRDSALNNGFSMGAFNPANLSGNRVQTAYDDNSNVIERLETDVSTFGGVADETFRTTSFYDSLDRLQTVMDNRGHTQDYRYDSRGNQVAMADAVGPLDMPATRPLPRRGLGSSATVNVNNYGNVTRAYYDGLSRHVESETMLRNSGQGNGTYLGADLFGVKLAPPSGYLDSGRAGDSLINSYFAYDANSQLLARRDDNGNTTAYIYDNQNRTLKERKGLNVLGASFMIMDGDTATFNVALRGGVPLAPKPATDIVFSYDLDSNVTRRNDEGLNQFDYTFDALNRQRACNITRAMGFVGSTRLRWQFDGLSRQTEATDDSDPSLAEDYIRTRFFYDSLSRKVEEQLQIGGFLNRATSSHYDIQTAGATDQPSALIFPDERRLDSTYDGLDRLVARRDNMAMTDIGRYEYLGTGRVALLTYQNNTRLTHLGGLPGGGIGDVGFDDLRRVTNHRWERFTTGQVPGSGFLLVGFGHQYTDGTPAYDRADNKLIEEKLHDLGNSEAYVSQSDYQLQGFRRGALNAARTEVVTDTTTGGALQRQNWTLDGLGNWTTNVHRTGGTDGTEERSSTSFNEINAVTGTPYGGGAAGTHQHDGNGNLTDDGVRLYEYDALNRLRRVRRKSDGMEVGAYSYDAGNRRVRSVVSNGGLDGTATNGTTDYYYDGWRVVEEHDGTDAITQQYVYGDTYLDEVWTLDNRRGGITVAQLNDGTGRDRHFYHSNTLYSVFGLTDEAGILREAYQYDAYGRQTVIRTVSPGEEVKFDGTVVIEYLVVASSRLFGPMGEPLTANPYLYTGQRLDAETKLDYYKERYYSTDLGRFLQRDPIGYQAGDGSLYRYVANNPTRLTDTLGLEVVKDDKAPLSDIFMDEWLYSVHRTLKRMIVERLEAKRPLDQRGRDLMESVKAVENLIKWRDAKGQFLEVNAYYITGPNTDWDFIRHAVKQGTGTINIYVGHGAGSPSANEVPKETLDYFHGLMKTAPWRKDKKKLEQLEPMFGFICCFGGRYSESVPEENRIIGSTSNKGIIVQADYPFKLRSLLDSIDDTITKRIKNKQKVTLNLYFGYDKVRTEEEATFYPKDGSYRFKNWK